MLVDSLVPAKFPDFPGRVVLGGTVLAVAVISLVLLVGTFLTRRTTLNPFASSSRLFVSGPYRFSRNPMYLGLLVAYLGGCVLAQSLWPLLLLVLPLSVLDRVVIPFEEASLRATFGADYDAYCARVGRWLSVPKYGA
jgi:protein-S-isoprenylcysteine O-methyltransferase Ste14